MNIITNHAPRPIVYGYELSAKERAEFDYLAEGQLDMREFVRYRGALYDLGDTIPIDRTVAPHPQRPGWECWDSYADDSFYSGVLFRFTLDRDHVVCGRYYC